MLQYGTLTTHSAQAQGVYLQSTAPGYNIILLLSFLCDFGPSVKILHYFTVLHVYHNIVIRS